jgi:hypothetical protein
LSTLLTLDARLHLIAAGAMLVGCSVSLGEDDSTGRPGDDQVDAGADVSRDAPSESKVTEASADRTSSDVVGTDVRAMDEEAKDAPLADAGTFDGGAGKDANDATSGDGAGRPRVIKFGPNIRVNDDPGSAAQVEVALAARPDGVLLAGWVDSRSGTRCAYSVSRDGGMTWGKNFTVASMGNGITGDTSVGTDEAGNLYLACQDYGTSNILFASSSDSGQTFTPWRAVQPSPDKDWVAGVRSGTVFLTWLGGPGGFRRSIDVGVTWDAVFSLGSLNHGTAIAPSTTGLVHVPYNQGSQVRYVRSKDWGATLEPGRNLADMGSACFGCTPRSHPIVGAACDPTGQTVAITWASTSTGGDGDDDVWAIVSKDAGDTWSKRLRVNDNTSMSRQFQPWVAVDRYGRVHVTWTDFRNGGQNATYYASALDPDVGFEPNVEVTDARGPSPSFLGDYKGIAVQGDDVLVIWADSRRGNGDIYFARATGAAGR